MVLSLQNLCSLIMKTLGKVLIKSVSLLASFKLKAEIDFANTLFFVLQLKNNHTTSLQKAIGKWDPHVPVQNIGLG